VHESSQELGVILVVLKRLQSQLWLTLLSIGGVILTVGLVTSIPVFANAVSFVVLNEELESVSVKTGRPRFSVRLYVLPGTEYPLSLDECETLGRHIGQTLSVETDLPLVSQSQHVETISMVLRTRGVETPYGAPYTVLGENKLAVLPGIASYITVLEGGPMAAASPPADELKVWMHEKAADQMGIHAGERFEIVDVRGGIAIPVRIAGLWEASDPHDGFWFSDPDASLDRVLLTRKADYRAMAEPQLGARLGFASWYVTLDDSKLVQQRMRTYAGGLENAVRVISKFLPGVRVDSSPEEALQEALQREGNLTALLFVFSVPVVGFLLYFLVLISTITIRWQQREIAVMASRGAQSRQLLSMGAIETLLIAGVGCPLGILLGMEVARLMGYTESFMSFTWRERLPVSMAAINVPVIAVAVASAFLARLWPIFRSARVSLVAHERARARASRKPLWQRLYLDFVLLVPVWYAYRQLSQKGTLVSQILPGDGGTEQDPLLFLVPALFTLALSLLLVRLFPLLMRVGDWLSSVGPSATFYLAFRQLSRQSGQYTSALLLVITALSLGAFMASMATSLDRWLVDRMYYAVGADVLIKQTVNAEEDELAEQARSSMTEGAWVLPVESYLQVPGVIDAARVGMYPASVSTQDRRAVRATFIGVDRLDLPRVLFFRPDFATVPLGELMNRLAQRQDAVLLSEKAMLERNYQVGDKVHVKVDVAGVAVETDLTIAGTYRYFPTIYEEGDGWGRGQTGLIGNLDALFEQIGGTLIHNIWLTTEPEASQAEMIKSVEGMGVVIARWLDTRERITEERAMVERVGILGTLTIGFLAAAVLSGIGLLVYNYASLQERLFRFTILRAVGLSIGQVIGQVTIEYLLLMIYSVLGGTAVGVLCSRLFIPFFQATDKGVLDPPALTPLIAWGEIGRIAIVFVISLIVAQAIVIRAALGHRVFQALRMGDRE
jgi:putative ABC transport system permease protein